MKKSLEVLIFVPEKVFAWKLLAVCKKNPRHKMTYYYFYLLLKVRLFNFAQNSLIRKCLVFVEHMGFHTLQKVELFVVGHHCKSLSK